MKHMPARQIRTPGWRASRTGKSSILAYAGHVLMENRNGLVAEACLTHASRHRRAGRRADACSTLGRQAADHPGRRQGAMTWRRSSRRCATAGHAAHRGRPARSASWRGRHSDIDGANHASSRLYDQPAIRKRIEEVFGWNKSAAGMRQTKHPGARPCRLVLHSRRLPPTIWSGCRSC